MPDENVPDVSQAKGDNRDGPEPKVMEVTASDLAWNALQGALRFQDEGNIEEARTAALVSIAASLCAQDQWRHEMMNAGDAVGQMGAAVNALAQRVAAVEQAGGGRIIVPT